MKPKRNSLTDKEVAIIKNLLNRRNYSNQKIAGMINRTRGDANNDISSGRISNIKNNQIKRYEPIPPEDDIETDKFLNSLRAQPKIMLSDFSWL